MSKPTPTHIILSSRRYEVLTDADLPKRTKARAGHLHIRLSPTDTPSPFRWPPVHHVVVWEGSVAVLSSKI